MVVRHDEELTAIYWTESGYEEDSLVAHNGLLTLNLLQIFSCNLEEL